MRGAHPASPEQQKIVRVWGTPGYAQRAGGEQANYVLAVVFLLLATRIPGYMAPSCFAESPRDSVKVTININITRLTRENG